MINLKTPYQNKKSSFKSRYHLIWCIIALFLTLSFAFKGICDDKTQKSTITLPTSQEGIEKIEYMINGVPKGSTNGIGSIEVENGAVLAFAIKFQSEGYSQLHVRDIKIQSEKGSVLQLNTFSEGNNGNLIRMRVDDTAFIDPTQTYISSDYVVGADDKFNISGISENSYSVVIKDEDNDVNLLNAVELKYSENEDSYVDAMFSEPDNAFILNNIKNSSNVKLMINVREGYTDSNLSLVYGDNELAISSKSKVCSLPEINDDLNLSIRGLQKKTYNLNFNEYTNAKFSYRTNGQNDFEEPYATETVYHGDTVEFTCVSEDNSVLENSEITANGIVISPENSIYKIENITSDCEIAITPKETALYPISLQNNETRIKLCDLSENQVSSVNVNQNGSASFKIIPSEAYSKYFLATQIYAVPISKTLNGTYDTTVNPDETNSFLIIPNSENIYSLENVTEPIVLIPTNLQASTHIVNIPDKIIGAKATVQTNDDVQQISNTKFAVTHGADFTVNIEAEPGYDISNMTIGDMDNSTQIVRNGNSYTYKNINSDKYLIINDASEAYCNVRFDSKNLVATDIYGSVWQDNSSTIKYQNGTIQFKIKLGDMQINSNIELSIISGDGKLEKISSDNNIYSLSNVTKDTVIGVGNSNSHDVTITLSAKNEDIQFTDINDESIILPEENILKLGQDFDFKVVSKSGRSVDDVVINSSNSNLIKAYPSISNAYTLAALNSDTISAETPTKTVVYTKSSSASPTTLRSLSTTPNTRGSGDTTDEELGNTNEGGPEDPPDEKSGMMNQNQADQTRKIVGLTLADEYIFPQAGSDNSTNDILPEVEFDKKPRYVLFSNDERALDCINNRIIEFNENTADFQISENRDKDKENYMTLPPLLYRYRDNKPNFNATYNKWFYIWGWQIWWKNDAYSPGDNYNDPANASGNYGNYDVGGTFSLKMKTSETENAKHKLSFDEYKISSQRPTYGERAYDRSFTLQRGEKTGTGNISPNNYVIANVPKVIYNRTNTTPNFAGDDPGDDGQNPYYFDDFDHLYPFIKDNKNGYEAPYARHDTDKYFKKSGGTYGGSTLTVQGPTPIFEAIHPYKKYRTFVGVNAKTEENPEGIIGTVNLDEKPETQQPGLLYRLKKAYCHVFSELYQRVVVDEINLPGEEFENQKVTISGGNITNEDNKKKVIVKPETENINPLKRVERSFNVYLPEGIIIKPNIEGFKEPLTLNNKYNEIKKQELKYDSEKNQEYIEVTANMSMFDSELNLGWKDGIEMTTPSKDITLNVEDIPRSIQLYNNSTISVTLKFKGENKPEQSADNDYEYTAKDIDFDYYTDPHHQIEFTVQLPENYVISEDQNTPIYLCLEDGSEPFSKLEQQEISYDRNKIICTMKISSYDQQKLYLKWKNFDEDISNTVNHVKFQSEQTVFRDSRETPVNSESVKVGNGLIFYTEPRDGCVPKETLIIDAYTLGTHQFEDILKLQYKDGDTTKDYNNQWIKILDNREKDKVLFIRAKQQGDMIKYETAAAGEITEYIEPIINNNNNNASSSEQSTQYRLVRDNAVYTAGLTYDLSISSIRSLRELTVTFTDTPGIDYYERKDNSQINITEPKQVSYGDTLAFKVVAEDGYDISNLEILSSTPTKTNTIPLTNGVYVIADITENTTISANNIQKSKVDLSFNQYEGVSYLDNYGDKYSIRQYVPYKQDISFQINVASGYSTKDMVVRAKIDDPKRNDPEDGIEFKALDKDNPDKSVPYIDNNLYVIPEEYVTGNIKISVNGVKGLEKITHTITLETPTDSDLSGAVSYRNQYGTANLSAENKVNYGESFSFQILTNEGFDSSQIEVIAKSNGGNAVTLIPANGVYTIENVTDDYTVTISGVKHESHTVEFRTSTGAAYLDEFGNTLPESVTVSDGGTISFYLSFDDAYNKSKSSAKVVIKGSNNTVPQDADGKYTLGGTTGIKENQIIEVTNVTKNTYTATFVPAEGVIYQTAKGKEFSGSLDLEYGESLYFKIALMDAYDQSTPGVKLNGNKNLLENSGSYVIENINDDVVITVENVEKNPEELAIDSIINIPGSVTTEEDVDAVVRATLAYESLSDDEKKLVTNKQDLEKAQNEAADINHKSGDITISGLDWYVKLIVTPLTDNEEQMNAFAEKIEKRSLLSLYKVELINLLNNEEYSIPYGNKVQITLPSPDLTGYKNQTVAHENLVGNIEYIDPNIVDGVAKFSATTTGLFGIAAKAIPNYSDKVSDLTISMGDLAKDDDELKTLIGDELSSQLGHLIDLEDDTNTGSGKNESSYSDDSSSDGSQNDDSNSSSDSLLNNMAKKATDLSKQVYNWALDNEFTAVILILFLGAGLIAIILSSSKKKENNKK